MKKYGFSNHHIKKLSDNSFSSKEEAQKFLLEHLHNAFPVKDIIENGTVELPEWNISIRPYAAELQDRAITTTYYISSPDWDEVLYECSTGIGSDQHHAMGMSQGSFLFGIMDTVMKMMNNDKPDRLESEFAGNKHNWSVYKGNIVGIGETPKNFASDSYWNALKDHIAKRIGNQKICYVKIYGANIGNGEIIGECRINDIKSNELSELVAEIVKTWGISQFGSHKQFIILKQDKETYIEQPFTKEDISKAVEAAMVLFEKIENEQYEQFPQMLEQLVGDKNLAWELYSFIPEICAENAFNKLNYPETITIDYNNEKHQYYKTQLFSYYVIHDSVFNTLDNGILKDTNKVYSEYISVSSVYSVICSAKEQGENLEENNAVLNILYSFDNDYQAR